MNLVGYRTYSRVHGIRRVLRDLPPAGDRGDAIVGLAIGGIAVALALLAAAGVL